MTKIEGTLQLPMKKGKGLRLKNKLQLYSLCVIPLLLVFVFSYLPMFGIVIAFKNYKFDKGIFGSEWVGLDNFKVFLSSDDFRRIAWNTIGLNLMFIAIGVACAVLLAVLLFEISSRKKVKVYQTVLITPNFISWVVAGYMGYAFLNPEFGLINKVIQFFGGEGIQWYSKPELWPFILSVIFVWKHVGMDSVVYYASLMGIDSSLFEAAKIDGANRIKIAWYVTIPQLVPLIVILTILKIGGIFRADFGLFYQMTRDISTLYVTTDVMDTYIFRTMRVLGDMSLSSAAGVLQSVVGFICVMLTNWITKLINPDNALF